MKYIQYDANQSNVDRMIQVERQKINHYKMLNTIYKKKSFSLLKQQLQINKDRSLRINNQIIDKQRKWKQTQKQINYQNSLLRNKLLHIYIPKDINPNQNLRTNQSLDTIYKDKNYGLNFASRQDSHQSKSRTKLDTFISNTPSNCKKYQTQKQLNQTNAKFFLKLSNIQSDIMPRLKLQQHNKQASYLKQMLMKKSPKRNLRMKKFVQRTISDRPKIHLPLTKSYRQATGYLESSNPEQPFLFY